MKKWALTILVLIGLGGTAGLFLYKPILETRLEAILVSQGLSNAHVEIARIGFGGATISELRFGEEEPLVLENIALNYSFEDLKQSRIDEIIFENIVLKAQQLENAWNITGLGALKNNGSHENPLSFLNITAEQIDQMPFRRLSIQDSQIDVEAGFGALNIPLNATWEKNKNPNLTYNVEQITFSQDSLEVTAAAPDISASFDSGVWYGAWSTQSITTNTAFPPLSAQGTLKASSAHILTSGEFSSADSVYKGDFTWNYAPDQNPAPVLKCNINIDMLLQNGALQMPLTLDWILGEPMHMSGSSGSLRWEQDKLALNASAVRVDLTQKDSAYSGDWHSDKISITAPMPVPLLTASGNVSMRDAAIDIGGSVRSADKSWLADFSLALGQKKGSTNGLKLKGARMPWNKGRISVSDIWIPFDRQKAIKLDIQVEQVDLTELMSTLTGGRIRAQGLVTGHVPLTIKPDGGISVEGGNLGAEGPGTIAMPPETIPANNERVSLVKDIMEDLHFEALNISAEPDENGELIIKLSVEGKNPKVLDGHPVKLNINLTGNLVEFIEQNLMLLTRPETLLKTKQD